MKRTCRTRFRAGWRTALGAAALLFMLTSSLFADDPYGEDAWRGVLTEVAGARLPQGASVSDILGPLPGETAFKMAQSLAPARFLELYLASGEGTQLVMRRSARARLRALSRTGALPEQAVWSILGRESFGVSGSRFFKVPPVPMEPYRALVSYVEFCASTAGDMKISDDNRERIERSLQAALAVSSPEVRMQYWDFGVVWTRLLMTWVCAKDKNRVLPGLVYHYMQLRSNQALDWLPPLEEKLKRRALEEGGAAFAAARKEAEDMPPTPASITFFKCGLEN